MLIFLFSRPWVVDILLIGSVCALCKGHMGACV
jgi:hypothetical protein